MKANFKKALSHVLEHEGGFVNHPKDPGGRTMRGVTQRVYNAYRSRKSLAYRDVRRITQEEIEDIYRSMYWNVIQADVVPAGVDLAWFDWAVNSGPNRATKGVQRALKEMGHKGLVVDGIVGPGTLVAIDSARDYHELVERICRRRLSFMQRTPIWNTFKRGWKRRVNAVKRASLDMVLATSQPRTAPKPAPKGLGEVGEKKEPPKNIWHWIIGLFGGGGAAGVVGAVNNPYALIAVAAVIGAVTVYFLTRDDDEEVFS